MTIMMMSTTVIMVTLLLVNLMMMDWVGRAEVQLVENALLDLGLVKTCAAKMVG